MGSDGRFAQLALALENYYKDHGCFPSLTTAEHEGGPEHSWRVELLPYFEMANIYDRYDFEKPWDSQENLRLSSTLENGVPPCYRSPLADGKSDGATNFVGITAASQRWPLKHALCAYKVTLNDDFFIIVEILDSSIHWSAPRDASV